MICGFRFKIHLNTRARLILELSPLTFHERRLRDCMRVNKEYVIYRILFMGERWRQRSPQAGASDIINLRFFPWRQHVNTYIIAYSITLRQRLAMF